MNTQPADFLKISSVWNLQTSIQLRHCEEWKNNEEHVRTVFHCFTLVELVSFPAARPFCSAPEAKQNIETAETLRG